MSTPRHASRLIGFVVFFSIAASAFPSPVPVQKQPAILTVFPSAAGLSTVVVRVPKGTRRVTLQALKAQQWVTRAVAHVDGSGANIGFQVPRGTNSKQLRVAGSNTDTLPTSFFKGKSNFTTAGSNPSSPSGLLPVGTALGTSGGVVASSLSSSIGTATAQPTVTESDIWKINGNTLFFFNQYRGLQIIDITNPDAPVMLGKLKLAAVGEEMYVLDASHVILLARTGNQWNQSEVIAVTVDNNRPSITARLPVNGTIDTSRLVGTALYVASEGWQASSNSTYGTYGTQLASFDFSNPAAPIARTTLSCSGYGNVTTVVDNYLFAATNTDWTHSSVCVVDISAPDGTMAVTGTLAAAGFVKDKFKMGLNGSVFTVISEIWPTWNPQQGYQQGSTKLETFSLSNPAAPAKLGEIGFGAGDWLYGTRIIGNLAYVVTAVSIDPLWIVDLSDPTTPTITGKLDVPGRSTYLQPLGGQLVTIGILNSKVAVSLFDVSDPAAPALLSQLSVGGTYSWSEANFDEKAFTVLSDANLILVPVNSYDPQSGNASQVQLIDIGANSLTLRGVIDAQFSPRRTTVFDQRILSISGRELLAVDDTDRDHPGITSDVALAWPVNQVFVQGDYLLEVENGGNWWNQSTPVVRVTQASDPDTVLTETDLASVPVCGATLRDGRLYVAQTPGSYYFSTSSTALQTTLNVAVYDLSQLPQVTLTGTTAAQVDSIGWNPSLKALWPNAGTLVWVASAQNYGPIFYPIVSGGLLTVSAQNSVSAPLTIGGSTLSTGGSLTLAPTTSGGAGVMISGSVTIPPITLGSGAGTMMKLTASTPSLSSVTVSSGIISSGLVIGPWWRFASDPSLITFDVSNPAAPAFLGQTKFASGAWSIGSSFADSNVVFSSHSGAWQPSPNIFCWAPRLAGWINSGWVQGWTLDVIDFTNPATPVIRDAVSIPSQLVGISNATPDGAVLYTEGIHGQNGYGNQQFLDAIAYDGVSASLIDSVTLPDWSNPIALSGSTVIVGHSAGANKTTGAIDTLRLGSAGKFVKLASVAVDQPPSQMRIFGSLLGVSSGNITALFDTSNPAALTLLNSTGSDTPFTLSLDRAAGDAARGIWTPLDDYGVDFLGVHP